MALVLLQKSWRVGPAPDFVGAGSAAEFVALVLLQTSWALAPLQTSWRWSCSTFLVALRLWRFREGITQFGPEPALIPLQVLWRWLQCTFVALIPIRTWLDRAPLHAWLALV